MLTRSQLIGRVIRVPKKNLRGAWWLTVIDVSDCRKFVKVGGGKAAGKPYWVGLNQCRSGLHPIVLQDE